MATWWRQAVIYQVYPRSFMDANGDGVGDLPGIMQRLDHLQWLGVDAIWLSPVYPSPMADFGYDISDHTAIHPLFGTLDDMDALIAAAHQRDLRVVLDFVPNHTSDQHPWFIEARASREHPKRDWYYWRDPAPGGGPPNNWLSRFDGGSAWEWDAATGQYYLHSFLKEQPDLNWRNPDLRAAMLDVMRFWLDRGVDGFRVDVPYRVMKAADLRDNPPNPDWREGMDPAHWLLQTYTRNYADSHIFNRWLREVIDAYPDRVLIGEMNVAVEDAVKHYGSADAPEFDLPFNTILIFSPWEAANVRAQADRYEAALPDFAQPNWVLSNHDQPRFPTRAGEAQARNGLLFLLTMRGTPVLYYGDEIGLVSQPVPPEKVQDPWELLTPGLGLGRDPSRTPMRWDGSAHAGFTVPDADPWLPVGPGFAAQNVAAQRDDPASVLNLARRLTHLRRKSPALLSGSYRSLGTPEDVFAYLREAPPDASPDASPVASDERLLVVLNFSGEARSWQLPEELGSAATVLSTQLDEVEAVREGVCHLRPHEGVLLRLHEV